jgi:hypothetical protein
MAAGRSATRAPRRLVPYPHKVLPPATAKAVFAAGVLQASSPQRTSSTERFLSGRLHRGGVNSPVAGNSVPRLTR